MQRFMLDKIQINLLLHILERDVLHNSMTVTQLAHHIPPWMLGMRAWANRFLDHIFFFYTIKCHSVVHKDISNSLTLSVLSRGKFVLQQLASF